MTFLNVFPEFDVVEVNEPLTYLLEQLYSDYPQLWTLRKAIRELRHHRKRGDRSFHDKLDRLRSRATEIEMSINQQLFGEARVIASTLVGSANRILEGQKYATLFIDEAAQALEATCRMDAICGFGSAASSRVVMTPMLRTATMT